ncbi:MAG: hypothetical protein ACXABY_37440 [Candidatus Thorarchaeota archaeon]|jgi:hypothetical protein
MANGNGVWSKISGVLMTVLVLLFMYGVNELSNKVDKDLLEAKLETMNVKMDSILSLIRSTHDGDNE